MCVAQRDSFAVEICLLIHFCAFFVDRDSPRIDDDELDERSAGPTASSIAGFLKENIARLRNFDTSSSVDTNKSIGSYLSDPSEFAIVVDAVTAKFGVKYGKAMADADPGMGITDLSFEMEIAGRA